MGSADPIALIEAAKIRTMLPAPLNGAVLLNVADLAVRVGNTDQAAASLAESRRLLETAFPVAQRPTESWRYAVWDTVNAELLARRGDAANARQAIASAAPVIARRFGSTGFYGLLAKRRSRYVEEQLAQRGHNL